jgi:hypothetical protein
MVTWRIVDDDVECLHVERNPTMTCSGSHLYRFYRFRIPHQVVYIALFAYPYTNFSGARTCSCLKGSPVRLNPRGVFSVIPPRPRSTTRPVLRVHSTLVARKMRRNDCRRSATLFVPWWPYPRMVKLKHLLVLVVGFFFTRVVTITLPLYASRYSFFLYLG